jgi:hypothetical protein
MFPETLAALQRGAHFTMGSEPDFSFFGALTPNLGSDPEFPFPIRFQANPPVFQEPAEDQKKAQQASTQQQSRDDTQ